MKQIRLFLHQFGDALQQDGREAVVINTALYDHCPELVAACVARGDELVGHGHTNAERQGVLDEASERALLLQRADVPAGLEQIAEALLVVIAVCGVVAIEFQRVFRHPARITCGRSPSARRDGSPGRPPDRGRDRGGALGTLRAAIVAGAVPAGPAAINPVAVSLAPGVAAASAPDGAAPRHGIVRLHAMQLGAEVVLAGDEREHDDASPRHRFPPRRAP